MPWYEPARPVRMQRVALLAPRDALRAALVRVAEAGSVQLDPPGEQAREGAAAARRLRRSRAAAGPAVLSAVPPDLDRLEREGRADLLRGEAELEGHAGGAVRRGSVAALAGWCPAGEVRRLSGRLAEVGAAAVPLPPPRGVDPPTLLRTGGALHRAAVPLVRTYGTVPYADADPAVPAAIAYAVMFGAMFGDAGQGLLLLGGAALAAAGRPARWAARLRPAWPFLAAAALASVVFGVLYGEFFGPTGVLPVLWLDPLEQPLRLLAAAVGAGAVLLALAYGAGTVNRWREGGPGLALYAPSGAAGAALLLGPALLCGGWLLNERALLGAGAAVTAGGLALAATGLLAAAPGGPGRAAQAGVQLVDVVLRTGTNVLSFARLAAFGLTHAALGAVVWRATTALGRGGGTALVGAACVFLLGNAVAFALEALVAAVQALRLEFYELFSRVFTAEGRPFEPWRPSVQPPRPPEAA